MKLKNKKFNVNRTKIYSTEYKRNYSTVYFLAICFSFYITFKIRIDYFSIDK